MMKHQLIINMTDPKGHSKVVFTGGCIRLRDRFLNMLFGKRRRILVLIPADSVQTGYI